MKNTAFAHSGLRHRLIAAQQKLLTPDLPLQTKAASYVRICCHAMVEHNRLSKVGVPSQKPSGRNRAPYLNFLRRLSVIDRTWWTTCSITFDGRLISDDEYIQAFLEVINTFVQIQTTTRQAA